MTAPLLRAGIVDFLITQRAESLIRKTRDVLIELGSAGGHVRELNHVPIQVITEFNLEIETSTVKVLGAKADRVSQVVSSEIL